MIRFAHHKFTVEHFSAHSWVAIIPRLNVRATVVHSTMPLGSEWTLTFSQGARAWAISVGQLDPLKDLDPEPVTADAVEDFLRKARDT